MGEDKERIFVKSVPGEIRIITFKGCEIELFHM